MYINSRFYSTVIMITPSTESKISQQPQIIYKTYTPQRQAYALGYYQKHKEDLKLKRKEYYAEHKDEIKQKADYKDKCKTSYSRYQEKLRGDPKKLEAFREMRRRYYQKTKLKHLESGGL